MTNAAFRMRLHGGAVASASASAMPADARKVARLATYRSRSVRRCETCGLVSQRTRVTRAPSSSSRLALSLSQHSTWGVERSRGAAVVVSENHKSVHTCH